MMSTLCGLPFWAGSQTLVAIQIQTKASYLQVYKQCTWKASINGSDGFCSAWLDTTNEWTPYQFEDYGENNFCLSFFQSCLCLLDERSYAFRNIDAYEKYLALLGVESKAYHADKGLFADEGF
jgi:hypothetical protein